MSEHLDYHAKLREELKALLDAFDDTIIVLSTRHIYIPVKPQAKQSARFGSGFASQPTKKKQYVANLRAKFEDEYKGVSPTIRPVRLTIYYCFPWTKTDIKSGKADRELWELFMPVPDLENMTKPLKDAMAGVVFMNDSQVVEEKVRKIRWPDPGIMIKVEEIKAKPIARPSGTPYTAG
jgi:Holliday junction resolvase RusA-like endonuclease